MRIIFAGTPAFAACALDAILQAGHAVPLVLTQPDRPSGRGHHVSRSAVGKLADAHGLPVYQPERLSKPEQLEPLLAIAADVMVVAAYGLILPPAALVHPSSGCYNIHASLLPRWRGAAPIQRALLAGDAQTGICIMALDAGLDSGPVASVDTTLIGAADTAGTVHDRLAVLGAAAIVRALARLERDGILAAVPQPAEGVTYASKIDKAEARIDWTHDAEAIHRQIRAFNPVPGAFTTHLGSTIKIWTATLMQSPLTTAAGGAQAQAGMLAVRCGDGGFLRLDEVQPAGGRRMSGTMFLNGRPEVLNDGFGT